MLSTAWVVRGLGVLFVSTLLACGASGEISAPGARDGDVVDGATPAEGGGDAASPPVDAGGSDAASSPRKDASARDAAAEGGAQDAAASSVTFGQPYTGGEFHLGPVDWEETAFHNACASERKYPPSVRALEGSLLAGIWSGLGSPEQYCDACIAVQTARGRSALLRVVTYGDTTPNSIDVSPEAFAILDSGEYPRSMSFQLVKCPDTGKVVYEFKPGTHQDWTAFWVRNARVPLARVEIQGMSHGYAACEREGDGSLVDSQGGVGVGTFSIRLTGVDGQQLVDTFSWPSGGIDGVLLEGHTNFD